MKLITRLRNGDGVARNAAFDKLIQEIQLLHDSKNQDYAADADPLSNFRRAEAFGVPAWKGILVRLSDKWSRIEQLANGKTPKNESLRDSLIDNAVYSLLCVLLLDEAQKREPNHWGQANPSFSDVGQFIASSEWNSEPITGKI